MLVHEGAQMTNTQNKQPWCLVWAFKAMHSRRSEFCYSSHGCRDVVCYW